MEKTKHLFYTILIILLNLNSAFAQTTEVSVKEMYKEFLITKLELNYPKPNSVSEHENNILKLFDISTQILKTAPNSLEACHVIMTFPTFLDIITDVPVKKYKEIKSRYYEGLNDPDTDTAEKLFFMTLSVTSHGSLEPGEKNPEEYKKCIEGLQKMKNECKNKDYQALATIKLFNEKTNEDCKNEFLNKFPNHLAVPYAKYSIISGYYDNENYEKCINELNELLKQYKDMVVPEGWKFEVFCYELIAGCYIELNDTLNAKKYLLLIEEKAPNNPKIKILKRQIDLIQNQPSDAPSKNLQKNK